MKLLIILLTCIFFILDKILNIKENYSVYELDSITQCKNHLYEKRIEIEESNNPISVQDSIRRQNLLKKQIALLVKTDFFRKMVQVDIDKSKTFQNPLYQYEPFHQIIRDNISLDDFVESQELPPSLKNIDGERRTWIELIDNTMCNQDLRTLIDYRCDNTESNHISTFKTIEGVHQLVDNGICEDIEYTMTKHPILKENNINSFYDYLCFICSLYNNFVHIMTLETSQLEDVLTNNDKNPLFLNIIKTNIDSQVIIDITKNMVIKKICIYHTYMY